ncbi:MAG: DUF2442 domain-containing protein [Pseudomonadota bacterium]|nr:DUF2442 domain-containing protein [Pseudomonadota bacterium]
MSKPAHRIKSAHTVRPHVLHVEWANGGASDIDLSATIAATPFFAPLKDAAVFMAARAGEWGWDVVWPGGVDMAADQLLYLALEQAGKADNARLRKWMANNGMTLNDAATALGMTPRTISAYGSGARPVPRTVALACIGWETLHGKKAA